MKKLEDGYEHLIYKAVEENELKQGFDIGHESMSQTKYINSIEVKDIQFVDMPGIKDTHNIEVDIVNSIVINNLAKNCKSLRLIIMINYC